MEKKEVKEMSKTIRYLKKKIARNKDYIEDVKEDIKNYEKMLEEQYKK